jgi:hypothetical protein
MFFPVWLLAPRLLSTFALLFLTSLCALAGEPIDGIDVKLGKDSGAPSVKAPRAGAPTGRTTPPSGQAAVREVVTANPSAAKASDQQTPLTTAPVKTPAAGAEKTFLDGHPSRSQPTAKISDNESPRPTDRLGGWKTPAGTDAVKTSAPAGRRQYQPLVIRSKPSDQTLHYTPLPKVGPANQPVLLPPPSNPPGVPINNDGLGQSKATPSTEPKATFSYTSPLQVEPVSPPVPAGKTEDTPPPLPK